MENNQNTYIVKAKINDEQGLMFSYLSFEDAIKLISVLECCKTDAAVILNPKTLKYDKDFYFGKYEDPDNLKEPDELELTKFSELPYDIYHKITIDSGNPDVVYEVYDVSKDVYDIVLSFQEELGIEGIKAIDDRDGTIVRADGVFENQIGELDEGYAKHFNIHKPEQISEEEER